MPLSSVEEEFDCLTKQTEALRSTETSVTCQLTQLNVIPEEFNPIRTARRTSNFGTEDAKQQQQQPCVSQTCNLPFRSLLLRVSPPNEGDVVGTLRAT